MTNARRESGYHAVNDAHDVVSRALVSDSNDVADLRAGAKVRRNREEEGRQCLVKLLPQLSS